MSTSLRQATPTTPEDKSHFLRLDGTSGAEVRALVDAERIVPISVRAQVLSAKLLLYKAAPWGAGSHILTGDALAAIWDPRTATWNDQPGIRASSTSTVNVAAGGVEGDLVELDVTPQLAASVSADDSPSARWYGMRLRLNTAGEQKFYSAFGPPEFVPKLRIQYNQPPDAPYDLLPSGDRAVSEVRPEFIWRFFDPDAGDELAFVQIQIATSDDFSTIIYDSGKVAHNTPRFDMASPPTGAVAPSDLAPNTTLYWRARHWDTHNLDSDWSSPVSFIIRIKGTFTLIEPSTSTVATPTPTFSWSLTTTTQTQYEVIVERKEAGIWVDHYRPGWALGTTTSHTLPDDYALQQGVSYRVTVRVKDQHSREDVPGDRAYYEDSQEFTRAAPSI